MEIKMEFLLKIILGESIILLFVLINLGVALFYKLLKEDKNG